MAKFGSPHLTCIETKMVPMGPMQQQHPPLGPEYLRRIAHGLAAHENALAKMARDRNEICMSSVGSLVSVSQKQMLVFVPKDMADIRHIGI
jgi:hypothetical protein